jgi:hypothetical protein
LSSRPPPRPCGAMRVREWYGWSGGHRPGGARHGAGTRITSHLHQETADGRAAKGFGCIPARAHAAKAHTAFGCGGRRSRGSIKPRALEGDGDRACGPNRPHPPGRTPGRMPPCSVYGLEDRAEAGSRAGFGRRQRLLHRSAARECAGAVKNATQRRAGHARRAIKAPRRIKGSIRAGWKSAPHGSGSFRPPPVERQRAPPATAI